jgi:hypothetical protein
MSRTAHTASKRLTTPSITSGAKWSTITNDGSLLKSM